MNQLIDVAIGGALTFVEFLLPLGIAAVCIWAWKRMQ